jgi:hypothetical protein
MVLKFRGSGLTQEVFAQEQGVKVGTLRNWLYKHAGAEGRPAGFAPVKLIGRGLSSGGARSVVTLRWPEGMEVAVELDGRAVAELVRELLRPCLR